MEAIDVHIQLEETYNHPIDRVWRAISDETEIAQWFIQADFKPVVGYQYTFTHESTRITGEVLVASKPSELRYTWIIGDPDTSSTVAWTLESIEGGTRVVLTHTGIESYGDSAAKMFGSFKQGWTSCLVSLLEHLSTKSSR